MRNEKRSYYLTGSSKILFEFPGMNSFGMYQVGAPAYNLPERPSSIQRCSRLGSSRKFTPVKHLFQQILIVLCIFHAINNDILVDGYKAESNSSPYTWLFAKPCFLFASLQSFTCVCSIFLTRSPKHMWHRRKSDALWGSVGCLATTTSPLPS